MASKHSKRWMGKQTGRQAQGCCYVGQSREEEPWVLGCICKGKFERTYRHGLILQGKDQAMVTMGVGLDER